MIEFNVNQNVLVKLNEIGIEELKRQHTELQRHFEKIGEFKPPVSDDQGYSKWQMHHLMRTFGHMMRIGAHTPFDANIKLVDE